MPLSAIAMQALVNGAVGFEDHLLGKIAAKCALCVVACIVILVRWKYEAESGGGFLAKRSFSMKARLAQLLGMCMVVVTLGFAAYVLGGLLVKSSIYGTLSIAGCRNCSEQSVFIYECFHRDLGDPCDPNQCIENQFLYAACEPTPSGQQDNCRMVHSEVPKWVQTVIVLDTPAQNCDETLFQAQLPQDTDCQSPGFNPPPIGKCRLDGCPGRRGQRSFRQVGRLICG